MVSGCPASTVPNIPVNTVTITTSKIFNASITNDAANENIAVMYDNISFKSSLSVNCTTCESSVSIFLLGLLFSFVFLKI